MYVYATVISALLFDSFRLIATKLAPLTEHVRIPKRTIPTSVYNID